MSAVWSVWEGKSNLFVVSLHSGHVLRKEVRDAMQLGDAARLREEDPYVDEVASQIDGTKIIIHRSRFEVDLNRNREMCIYSTPDKAWGIDVWGNALTDEITSESYLLHDAFYAMLHDTFSALDGSFLVWDVHSYNLIRDGHRGTDKENPEINLGTSHNHVNWDDVGAFFLKESKKIGYDARENVKFGGGYLSQWVSENFGERACTLSVEFRKDLFMDEETGLKDEKKFQKLQNNFLSISDMINSFFLDL